MPTSICGLAPPTRENGQVAKSVLSALVFTLSAVISLGGDGASEAGEMSETSETGETSGVSETIEARRCRSDACCKNRNQGQNPYE